MSRPGPWLRLTAVFAGLSTLLAVVSGAASLGAAHRVLAALALPPLLALVLAAVLVHRRLLAPSVSALVLFGIAALVMYGRRSKLCGGGGEVVYHSSVSASHGSFPARRPF